MKNKFKILIILLPALLLVMAIFSGCEKQDNLNTFTVQGKIVSLVPPCEGNGILISVENIQDFGVTDSFMFNAVVLINYENAILVPFFDKYKVKGSYKIKHPIIEGSSIEFECRAATEADYSLFAYYEYPCLAIYGPVSAPCYVITKIINYHNP
jgi:hypothetical protein